MDLVEKIIHFEVISSELSRRLLFHQICFNRRLQARLIQILEVSRSATVSGPMSSHATSVAFVLPSVLGNGRQLSGLLLPLLLSLTIAALGRVVFLGWTSGLPLRGFPLVEFTLMLFLLLLGSKHVSFG